MKTYSTRASEVRREWHVLDATGVPLGRLASQAAALIRGKHKVMYAPNLDTGDYVVVLNAARVGVTGRKLVQKKYYRHSQYPSGMHIRTLREQLDRNATKVIEHAVQGMLPHNRLGRSLHGHLKVYLGGEHPHDAQVNGPAQPALSQPPRDPRRKKAPIVRRSGTATTAVAAPLPMAIKEVTPAGPVAVRDAPGPVVAIDPVETVAAETAAEPAAVVMPESEAVSESAVSESKETEA